MGRGDGNASESWAAPAQPPVRLKITTNSPQDSRDNETSNLRSQWLALFTYLLAVSLLLGSGYVSLRWLSAPDASANQRPPESKMSPAHKDVREDPGAEANPVQNPSNYHSETETIAK
jgi:hypothetical protein